MPFEEGGILINSTTVNHWTSVSGWTIHGKWNRSVSSSKTSTDHSRFNTWRNTNRWHDRKVNGRRSYSKGLSHLRITSDRVPIQTEDVPGIFNHMSTQRFASRLAPFVGLKASPCCPWALCEICFSWKRDINRWHNISLFTLSYFSILRRQWKLMVFIRVFQVLASMMLYGVTLPLLATVTCC